MGANIMDIATITRIAAIFLIFAVTLALNVGDNMLARLGLDSVGLIFLGALVMTLFLAGRHAYIVAAAVLLCLIANMPSDFALNFGFDRDYYAGIMMALALQPILARVLH